MMKTIILTNDSADEKQVGKQHNAPHPSCPSSPPLSQPPSFSDLPALVCTGTGSSTANDIISLDSRTTFYFSLSDNEDDESASVSSSSSSSTTCIMSDLSSDRSEILDSDSSIAILSPATCSSMRTSSNASAAWSQRRQRMEKKKEALPLTDRVNESTKTRNKFPKHSATKETGHSKLYTNYSKEKEENARAIVKGTSDTKPEGVIPKACRCVRFEIFHSLPAAISNFIFCISHVAIYEFFQMFAQDFLELNDCDDQFMAYIGVLSVALFMARACGSLWEWVGDDTYDEIKFDMRNKFIKGDLDARVLRWFKHHPKVQNAFEVSSLYLCYVAASYVITELMLKNVFDMSEVVLEGLPSSKYPDLSTHIKTAMTHGELMFEDAALATAEHGSAASSSACAVLPDLCDEHVFQACNALEEFRAKLNVDDGVYLEGQVSVDTYYKVIGDNSAGIYYYQHVMIALLGITLAGALCLKHVGVGFWDR